MYGDWYGGPKGDSSYELETTIYPSAVISDNPIRCLQFSNKLSIYRKYKIMVLYGSISTLLKVTDYLILAVGMIL